MHTMNVKTKYYNLLKSGQKIVELRLFDEKRQKIKVGDEILFLDASNSANNFKAAVENLYYAESFSKLCEVVTPKQAGFVSEAELITALEEFYTPSVQKKFGVVGIKIKKI